MTKVNKTIYNIILVLFASVFSGSILFAQTYTMGSGSASSGSTISTCSGTFYDSGGSSGSYNNSENYSLTFSANFVTGSSLWLKADVGTNSTTNGANISSWQDCSGTNNNASGGSAPTYGNNSSDYINFNPVVKFSSGSSQYMNLPNGTVPAGSGNTNLFAVTKPNSLSVERGIIGLGVPTSGGAVLYGLQNGSMPFYFFNSIWNQAVSEVVSNSVLLTEHAYVSGTRQVYLNGSLKGSTNSGSANLSSTNTHLGASYAFGNNFDGSMAEVIFFPSNLSETNKNKIESYLAIKYGITLDQSTAKNYIASDGTTIFWNGTTNSAYKNNIAGISRDDLSALNQKQSKSVNSGLQVVIGNGNTIAANNTSNANNFSADKSALIWGDNASSVAAWTATGAPVSRQVVARTWKVQETGTVGSVKVQIADNSGANGLPAEATTVYLLVDADGNFAAGATEIAMTLNGMNWEANVDLVNGQFFTFATQVPSGPGGVSSNNVLWLKPNTGTLNGGSTAGNGQNVTTWQDQSGNGNNFTTATTEGIITGAPTWISNQANYNPALGFNGTQGLQLLSNIYSNNSNFNIFQVHTNSSSSSGMVFVNNSNDNQNPIFSGYGYAQLIRSDAVLIDVSNSGTWEPNVYHLSRTNTGGSNYTINNYFAGKSVGSATSTANFASNNNKTTLGYRSYYTDAGRDPRNNGPIHEIIVYNNTLTTTEIQRINSYLAIKYGSTLDQSTPQNYIASNGTTVYWNATANAGYKNNIAGIARDDNSALNQKQSKSSISGFQVAIGNGNTIAANNASNANNFSTDKSALVWGDNAASIAAWTASGAPTTRLIIARTWKVQETGSVGSVKVQIADNSGPNGLPAETTTVYLLVDADGNFASGATEIPMTLNGSNWETTYDFSNGQYFTFATLPPTYPGCSVQPLQWLKADANISTSGSNVTSWNDNSGNSNNVNNSGLPSGISSPTYSSGASINFNPSVDFNGGHGLKGNSAVLGQNAEYTAFIIREKTAGVGTLINQENTSGGVNPGILAGGRNVTTFSGGVSLSDINTTNNIPNLFTFSRDNTSGSNWTMTTKLDGGFDTNSANATTNPTSLRNDFTVGYRYINGTTASNQYYGKIGEIILFNSILSTTETNKVETYLAIKYGITLAHDYFSGNGTNVFSVSSYGNNIAGIGRDDCQNLMQKQSRSVNSANSGGLVTIGLGAIAANNLSNPNSISTDKNFLVWGDNLGATNLQFTNFPSGSCARMTRVWKTQETGGEVGNLQVKFDLSALTSQYGAYSASNLFLIVNNTANFSSALRSYPATSYSSGLLTFDNVDLDNGEYFTISAKDPNFNPVVSSNSPVCYESELNLYASGGTSYTWQGPNGFNSTQQNPTLAIASFADAGTYSVTISTGFGCSSVQTINVVVENCNPDLCVKNLCNNATVAGNISATDPDNDALTYSVKRAPLFGTLSLSGQNYVYDPINTFVGEDYAIIETCDNNGACVDCYKYFVVSACNTPPICGSNNALTVCKGLSGTGTLNATDPAGGAITYSIVSQPSSGTVSLSGANYTYQAAPNFEGSTTFTYRATNATGSVDCIVTIYVVNCFSPCGGGSCNPTNLITGGSYGSGTATNVYCSNTITATSSTEYCFSASITNNCASCDSTAYLTFTVNNIELGRVNFTSLPLGSPTVQGFSFNTTQIGNPSTMTVCVKKYNFGNAGTDIIAANPSLKSVSDLVPIANDDVGIQICSDGGPYTINVLENDLYVLNGNNPTIVSNPPASQGSVVVSGSSIIFTPNASYTGTSTFTYQICNGICCDNATVTIEMVNPQISLANTTLCTGQNSILSAIITGIDTSMANYSWESSPDNSTWTPISGANYTVYTTPILNSTTYYRISMTPLGSACSVKSATASAQVSALTASTSVSACINQPLADIATVTVQVTWPSPALDDVILVSIESKTERIDIGAGATSPYTVTFNVPANGAASDTVSVNWENGADCPVINTYAVPNACSNDTISCKILYLCGEDKPYDGDAWDHGFMEYVDAANGIQTVTGILTKPDASGMGTYDVNNPSTPVSVNLSEYDLIIVSATTEAHIAADLVDSLKITSSAVLNSNYLLIDDLGLSATNGAYQFQTNGYIDNSTSEEIYNYNNFNPTYSYVMTNGNPVSGADSYLWTNAGDQAANIKSIFYVYDINDVLPGVPSTHGRRVYLGYHMNGIYANPQNGGALPSPTANWFNPAKHLTTIGKDYFDQALIAASLACNDEICDDNIDNDGNGLTDCDDPACGFTDVGAASNTGICAGASINLSSTTTGGEPIFNWSWVGPNGFTSTAQNPSISNASPSMSGTYNLTITDAHGCTDTASVFVSVLLDPNISASGSTTICSGGTASLSATVSGGSGTCTVQWQSSPDGTNAWTDLSGQTNNTYTTAALTTTTYYRATYSCTGDGCTTSTSPVLTVTVLNDPIVNINGADVTVCIGGSATLSANVSGGTGTISYQWQNSTNGSTFTNISGATNQTYTTPALSLTTYYKVLISFDGNGCESATSTNATINVVPDPTVSVSGPNTICNGGSVQLTATTSGGTGTCSLQWQYEDTGLWINIPGATSTTYSTPALSTTTNYRARYSCTGGGCDLVTSSVKVINVVPDPVITAQPQNDSICAIYGSDLTVDVTGGIGPFTYNWQYNNGGTWQSVTNNIPAAVLYNGQNTDSLVVTPFGVAGNFQYRVLITDQGTGCDVLTSNIATIIVSSVIQITAQPTNDTMCVGNGHAELSVTAAQPGYSGVLKYQWQYNNGGTWVNVINGNPAGASYKFSNQATLEIDDITAAGTYEYRVEVDSKASGCDKSYSANTYLVVENDPSITISGATTICTGGTATLIALTTGGAKTCSIQWQFSPNGTSAWTNISGATSTSFTTPPLSTTSWYRALYTCTGDDCDAATSNVQQVTVVNDPVVSIFGADSTICVRGNYTLVANVTGGAGNVSYQWQSSSDGITYVDILAATNQTFDTPGLTQTTYYKVLISFDGNGCESATSAGATVNVVPDPTVSIAGPDTICIGGTALLTAATSGGTGTCTMQWQEQANGIWVNIPGATSATYTTASLTTTTNYRVRYFCTGGGCDLAISNIHTVNVVIDPTISISVPDPNICVGGSVVISATTSGGTGTCTIQWQNSTDNTIWTDIPGATGPTYSTPALSSDLYYKAVIECTGNGCCD